MTKNDILAQVKLNVDRMDNVKDGQLIYLIDVAIESIQREGVHTLDIANSYEDANLVVAYTAHLFRNRNNNEITMPRMLRFALNNRLLSEKAKS